MKSLRLRSFSPPSPPPDRVGANGVLLATAAVILFHVSHLPAWITLGVCSLIAWRYLIEAHGRRTPGRVLRVTLTMAAALAVYAHYGSVLGRDAGVALLICLVGLKLIETRQVRDYFFTIFLLYVLILSGFLFSQSLAAGAYGFAAAAAVTTALMRLNQPGAPMGRTWRLTGAILVRALPLMLVIYLLFPRIQGSLWGLPGDAFGGRTGLNDEVRPGTIQSLVLDDRAAFRVEFESPIPEARERYWRALVLSETDGRVWRRGGPASAGPIGETFEGLGEPVRYTVTYEPSSRPWLAALDLPARPPAGARFGPGFVIRSDRPLRERVRYAFESYPRYRTGALDPAGRRHHLALPARASERVEALVGAWARQAPHPEAMVAAALEHFRSESFYYTLQPPLLGPDPLDEFLFETRAGYCEHYAAAFVSLMRMAGIPSRMVVGFQGGAWNDAGGYLLVRQSDAHAWAEVSLPGNGWTRVDPTAAVAPERVTLGVDALRRLSERGARIGALTPQDIRRVIAPDWLERRWRSAVLRWDAVNTAWHRWVLAYGPEQQARLMRALGFTAPSWFQQVATMAGAVALLLLIFAALLLRSRRRLDPVTAAYRRFCNKMARRGITRAPHEGPRDYERRIRAQRNDLAHQTRAITALYIGLRYGRADRRRVKELRAMVARL